MSDKKIHLRVITPIGKKIDESVDMVIMRCTTGSIGILPGHRDYTALLDAGDIRILLDEKERTLSVHEGLFVIRNNVLTILSNEAESPEDLSIARANAEQEIERQREFDRTHGMELQSDQAQLRRALVQLEVSASTLGDPEE